MLLLHNPPYIHLITDGPRGGMPRRSPFVTFGNAGFVRYRNLDPRRRQNLTTSRSGLAPGFGSGGLRAVGPMAPPAAACSTPRGPQNQFQHTEKWVTELVQTPGMSPVLTAGALLSKSSSLPSDHMFTAFLKLGLIRNMLCLYSSDPRLLHSIVTLGSNVCGHQGIVHGGLTAALVDETLGALVYILKREGIIGDGPSFTVRLEMDYKKPVPASTIVCCTAELQSAEGRKAWVKARVQDQPGGVTYAEGKALFVIPRAHQPNA